MIELGADVNAGDEAEVPICLAVQSGKKDMVELLLQKGASNTQKALDLAREKRFDEIIGLLLAHIALEKSSEVVNLSGLELNRIQPTWILPSLGIFYSPPKRRISGHRRNRSLGQMKEILMMRRKSVDLLSLQNSSISRVESDTGGRSSGADESDTGVHMSLQIARSGIGIGARNEFTPPSRKSLNPRMRINSAVELLPSKVRKRSSENSVNSRKLPISQSSPILSKRQLDLSGRLATSGSSSPQNLSDKDTNDQPQTKSEHKEAITPLLPPSRARKTGVVGHASLSGFEPTLSPIHGTPSHSLHRHNLVNVDETDSGVDNGPVSPVDASNKEFLRPSPSDDSLSSAATVGNNGLHALNITPRSRRYRERKGTVTGARVLPFSNANEYLNRHRAQEAEAANEGCPSSPERCKIRKEFSMSPSQLFKRFRKHREKRQGRKVSNSVFYTPRSGSPIAIGYPRADYEASGASDSNEYSYSKGSKSADELEMNSFNDDDAFVTPGSQNSSRVLADGFSLSAVSQKLQRLRKKSTQRLHQRRQSTSTRECSPSSSSSSVMTTPCTSIPSSRRASVDGLPSHYRQGRDEVDFGTYEAIPEESVTSEVYIMGKKLVRMVDLSSNILTTLSDLADAPGHELVVQQMAQVCKLDLKQNQLESLPRTLIKVSEIS